MSVRMRIVAGAAGLAAFVLSVSTAAACGGCGGCGCGYQTYAPVTVYRPVTVYAPVQPTYAVNQGPVYNVPAPTAVEPVPEYIYPPRGYRCGGGCGGAGYAYGAGFGYGGGWYRNGFYRRHVWFRRGGRY